LQNRELQDTCTFEDVDLRIEISEKLQEIWTQITDIRNEVSLVAFAKSNKYDGDNEQGDSGKNFERSEIRGNCLKH
jgi:hypothetical protein